jgi:hypothetical protein
MSEVSAIPLKRVLDPMERISETLFGLIMALTFTRTLGLEMAGQIKIQTVLIGALGRHQATDSNSRHKSVVGWLSHFMPDEVEE